MSLTFIGLFVVVDPNVSYFSLGCAIEALTLYIFKLHSCVEARVDVDVWMWMCGCGCGHGVEKIAGLQGSADKGPTDDELTIKM